MCYCQQRKVFSVDDVLENAIYLGMCGLFEQTSPNAYWNLSKCEGMGFTTDKNSSVIFNSTGYLAEADEVITEEGVYKLEKFADGYDVNLTDEEAILVQKLRKDSGY